MNTQQPVESEERQPPIENPALSVTAQKSHTKLALVLMVTPSALIILSLILSILLHPLFTDSSEGITLLALTNITSFFVGAFGVLTWIPGLVAGIIILAKQKK